ncbi:MAG: sensor histidine kinase [Methylococcus sp.]
MKTGSGEPAAPDTILPRSLRFEDSGLEREFEAWQFASVRRLILTALAILLPITVINLFLDFRHSQGAALSPAVGALRVLALGFEAAGLAAILRNPGTRHARPLVEAVLVLLMATTLMLTLVNPDYYPVGVIAQLLYIFVVYLVCPFPWLRQVAYAGLFSMASLLLWEHRLGPTADFIRLAMAVPFANLLGATLARQRHRHERRLFASERRLARQLDLVRQFQQQQSAVLDLLTHELRHPLANIAAQGELIRRLDDPPAMRAAAERIVQASTRSARLIGEWIKGDRIAASAIRRAAGDEPVQLLDVVREAVRDLAERHPGIPVRIHGQEIPAVMIERRVLALAVHNLLENAARHAGSARGIDIRCRVGRRRVTLRIRDYGPGLSAKDQDRIFEKYVMLATGPSQAAGLGVGLFLVREMLDRCGARIRVQSVPGRGTAFLIELPQAG